uniref:Uncharacterized protein n=1 Tax=Magallana gigas TaxID=29159 RepID=A0A8W8NCW6_MAGGI
MLRSKRKSKSPYARPNAHPALRALNPATTATQTQAGPSRPTQAAVQFVSTQPQNQEHQLPVDDPTTSEQTAVPLPSIAPSIPLSTSDSVSAWSRHLIKECWEKERREDPPPVYTASP